MKTIIFFAAMLISGFASAQVQYVPQDHRPAQLVGPTVRMCGYEPCFRRDERERQIRQYERYQRQSSEYHANRYYNPPQYQQQPAPMYPQEAGVSFNIQLGGYR